MVATRLNVREAKPAHVVPKGPQGESFYPHVSAGKPDPAVLAGRTGTGLPFHPASKESPSVIGKQPHESPAERSYVRKTWLDQFGRAGRFGIAAVSVGAAFGLEEAISGGQISRTIRFSLLPTSEKVAAAKDESKEATLKGLTTPILILGAGILGLLIIREAK